MESSTLRQRRNLIVVSTALLLVDFAHVSITRVSILGVTLVVGRPEVIYTFAWVVWFYFLARYLQHYAAEEDRGIQSGFQAAFERSLSSKINQLVEGRVREARYTNYGPDKIQKIGFLSWQLPLQLYEPATGKVESVDSIEVPRWNVLKAILVGLSQVIFVTPKATDYFLPIILALSAPVVTLCH